MPRGNVAFWGIIAVSLVGFVTLIGLSASIYSSQSSTHPTLLELPVEPSCNQKERDRRMSAFNVRKEAALYHVQQPAPCHPNNGDEDLYSTTYFGQFSKGMPHDANGLPDVNAYRLLLKAAASGVASDFDAIPQGGVRDYTNPQAAFAYVLEGADSHSFVTDPAPEFSSAQRAADMVENYWMALTRDIPYESYDTDPLIAQAVADMQSLSDYRGPAPINPSTLFRGTSPGCLLGPHLSQFFYQPAPFGATHIEMRMTTPVAGQAFLTDYAEWLSVQNGNNASYTLQMDPVIRYPTSGKDLSQWVHMDVLFQAYFNAMLQLMAMNATLKPGIPYQNSELNQMGFGTFGPPHIAYMTTASSMPALKAAFYQKWVVHRTIRPEEYGGRVHLHKLGTATFPIHNDLLNSQVLTEVFNRFGTYLLPQAFAEGCPAHPSYCAGHATVAGAAVTILKALFDEDFVIPQPLVPDITGTVLLNYTGPDVLTVGGELNKLMWGVGNGRVVAGVHYRSDTIASLKLGEQVAIELLRDYLHTFNEPFVGWTFRDVEGATVNIKA
jgi:hypothetical protein